jgi:hypothetical protein
MIIRAVAVGLSEALLGNVAYVPVPRSRIP